MKIFPQLIYKLKVKGVNLLFTLCPLYQPGKLQNSQLLSIIPGSDPIEIIKNSRVGKKWEQTMSVLKTTADFIESQEKNFQVEVVFANKGVLLNHEPNEEDCKALADHDSIYRQAIGEELGKMGIEHHYWNYQDFEVQYPDFVNPKQSLPQGGLSICTINQYLNDLNIGHPGIVDNRHNRKRLKRLTEMEGISSNAIFVLVTGYLAFDHKIVPHIGEKGIYMVAERFDPLFAISKFTPDLAKLAKIKIKA